ncbi:hypothetical protein HJA85_27120 [Rhizobium bangladeshense]|uniref:hypothetical protein n=1 Tax=Rhizobium bangladeshense TaxID=1138189 RepID=UPI001C83F024|nr:hypothetical protein [Rhizobium bangladeshense]MBX4870596.1 hypothetical protein [Rhizobium bangladeshense]MBX4872689.1 hypothetical protein [Rhizobium bangladeshense]
MTKLRYSKIYRPYYNSEFGPRGTVESGSITLGRDKKENKECLTMSFKVGYGRPWDIQLLIHPSDFDDIASAMMKLDKERALRAFAKAVLD